MMQPGLPEIGIRLDQELDPHRSIELAVAAESGGYSSLWFAENPLHRAILPAVSACALRTERVRLGLRAEFFNVFNHPNFGDPVGDISSRLFGLSTQTLARSLGLSARRIFMSIVVPTALPSIFAGLRLGLIYTLLGVVTAELIAGGKGLGSQISYYSNTFDANGVFAVLLVLIVLADLLSALMTKLERRLTRWKG